MSNRELRIRVSAAVRALGRQGYDFGFNGHITVQAQDPDTFLVSPWLIPLATVQPDDLLLINSEGEILENVNNLEIHAFQGNLRFHAARNDVKAVVHLHTPAGFAYSSLGQELKAVNTDAALVTKIQALHVNFGVEGHSPVSALGSEAKVLLQKSHGFITVGRSIEEAAFLLIAAERSASQNLSLAGIQGTNVLDDETQLKWKLDADLAEKHFAVYLEREV